MTVAAILAAKGNEVVTVSDTMTVKDVVATLSQRRIGAVLVTDSSGDVIGVLSERDVVRCLASDGPAILDRPAKALMTSPVLTCRPTDPVQDVMALMTERRIRHVPVVEEGRLLGIVSIGDLVKRRIEDVEHEAAALKTYITSS